MWKIFGRIDPNQPERLRFSFISEKQAQECIALLKSWRIEGPDGPVPSSPTTYGMLENPRSREEEKNNR